MYPYTIYVHIYVIANNVTTTEKRRSEKQTDTYTQWKRRQILIVLPERFIGL